MLALQPRIEYVCVAVLCAHAKAIQTTTYVWLLAFMCSLKHVLSCIRIAKHYNLLRSMNRTTMYELASNF